MEAIATAGAGTLVIVKEKSPTNFEVEQRLKTMPGARNIVLDTKTNHVITNAFEYGPVPRMPNRQRRDACKQALRCRDRLRW